jgi:hypothetical protein
MMRIAGANRMRVSTLLVLVCLTATAQAPSPNGTIVRIAESTIDYTNPSSDRIAYGCVEVSKNGDAYVIRKEQILPASGATVRAYRAVLNSSVLDKLNLLVSQDSLLRLPDVGVPHFSGDSNFVHRVLVTAYRGDSIQRIHADDWYDAQGVHYKGSTAEYKQGQQELNESVKPIMEWFHELDMNAFHLAAREGDRCMD